MDSGAAAKRTEAAITPHAPGTWMNRRKPIQSMLVAIVPAAIWLAPLPLDPKSHRALAICAFMILGWITEVLDHGVTGIIGCYLFWMLGVVRFDVAFSGFANDSSWFAPGAMLFGIMGGKSGLGRRLAYGVMLRIGTTYSSILLALILTDFVLTLLIPAGLARVVILAPVALGLVEAWGLAPGGNIGRGMFLILTYTAGVFDKTIIAGSAAITARGLIETLGATPVLWSRWFLAYLPSDFIIIVAAWRITLWLYPPEQAALPGGTSFLTEELRSMGRWTNPEKKSLLLMLLAAALWMTDFLHHLPPSMICIGIALLALLPATGVLELGDLKRKNYILLFFFVASALSLGEVLKATNILSGIDNHLFSLLGPFLGWPYLSSFILYWTGFVSHIFLGSEVSMLGMSMPVLMNFAHAHGLNPLALGMIWTFASGGKIFVYQSAVMIAGYSYGYFTARDLFRLGLCMSIVDSIQLLLLVPLYWPLIGIGSVAH
jgi:anion transporter